MPARSRGWVLGAGLVLAVVVGPALGPAVAGDLVAQEQERSSEAVPSNAAVEPELSVEPELWWDTSAPLAVGTLRSPDEEGGATGTTLPLVLEPFVVDPTVYRGLLIQKLMVHDRLGVEDGKDPLRSRSLGLGNGRFLMGRDPVEPLPYAELDGRILEPNMEFVAVKVDTRSSDDEK